MTGEFSGWTGDFQAYFIGLQLDNSKRYFEANRELYQQVVRAPLEALVKLLEPEFGPGRVYRPHRNLRFSRDKTPYKTNVAASIGAGYVSLDAGGLFAAVGRYHLEPDELARYRAAVGAEMSGAELQTIVSDLRAGGYDVRGEEMKRLPAGYPRDHPRAALLRHKRLYVGCAFGLQPWLARPEAAERVAAVFRGSRPLADWLAEHVG